MEEILSSTKPADYRNYNQRFYYTNDCTENNFLTIGFAGITYPTRSYAYQHPNLPNYVFEYVTQGTIYIESGGKKYTAAAGSVYVLRRGIAARYYGAGGKKISKTFFNAHGKLVDKLFEAFDLNDDVLVVNTNIESEIQQIHSLLLNRTNSAFVTSNLARLVFEVIMKISMAKNSEDFSFIPGSSIAQSVKNQIDSAQYYNTSLKRTAARFNVTDKYIIKEFKKAYGQTPHAYLIQKRIQAAKQLLKNSSLTIKEISNELCFSDNNYFSKAFKRQTGMSPIEYRKQSRKESVK